MNRPKPRWAYLDELPSWHRGLACTGCRYCEVHRERFERTVIFQLSEVSRKLRELVIIRRWASGNRR